MVAYARSSAIMMLMDEKNIDKFIEKAKLAALKAGDRVPLPLHYVFNALLLMSFFISWGWPFDPVPLLDEALTAVAVYYYNAYILKRTFGVLNPMRILRGESPAAKRRLGLLP